MDDWLLELQTGQRVLDLCSGAGSFSPEGLRCAVVALDEDVAAFASARPLQPDRHYRAFGKSDQIPFSDASFDLVICHHGLEHIPTVEKTLGEIGRVLKPDGRLVVSIPNGYGLCDGIYRFVFEGGGHVNRFTWQRAVELVPTTKDAMTGTKLNEYLAIIYAWTGERKAALDELSKLAHAPSSVSYGDLKLDPYWDPLRGDPRFEKLVTSLAPDAKKP